ncbi:MAG: tRNA pseudouridine(38-40) synthase TruA [Planctomycetia bacterium]|nr:tRNA pseudouridine(38-40) synthase TruA [Planctomycetia bacterium]
MRTIRFTLAYDGTNFHGWQFQPNLRTVQGCVMEAARKITGTDFPEILGSSRTDTGVHALGQLAALWTDSKIPISAFPQAMNANLPADILVLEAAEETVDFHPIRNTTRKRYRYLMHDGPKPEIFMRHYCWRLGKQTSELNVPRMQQAAKYFLGTHDFSAFENQGSPREHSIRTIFDFSVRRSGTNDSKNDELSSQNITVSDIFPRIGHQESFIILEVEADGFLYNMVRNLAGALYDVGRGHRPPEWVQETLLSRNRQQGGMTAPAQGLFLLKIETASVVENPFKKLPENSLCPGQTL